MNNNPLVKSAYYADTPVFPESDILQIRQHDEHVHNDPLISVIATPNGSLVVYVQVDFWKNHVRWPFHFDSGALSSIIWMGISEDFIVPMEEDEAIGIGIQCTK